MTITRTLTIRRPHAPWLTTALKLILRIRDKALRRFRRKHSSVHGDIMAKLQSFTEHQMKSADEIQRLNKYALYLLNIEFARERRTD